MSVTHQLSQPEIGYVDPTRTAASDPTSHIPNDLYLAFKSQQDLDNYLIANGFSAKQVSQMITNDKVYAARQVAATSAASISAINPATGAAAGSTVVTIVGSGLTSTSAVTFGGTAGTSVTVLSDTAVSVTTPSHAAGAVDVAVTKNGKTTTKTNGYTYV